MTLGEHVGQQVRRLRRARRWSQTTLAQRATLGRITIVRIERATHDVGLATLDAIATALGVPLRSLLPGRGTGVQYERWTPPSDMLTQHRKRLLAARPDKPQYPARMRKLTVVQPIPIRPTAEAFIQAYEYLGDLSVSTRAAYGLFTPDGELLGVECFGAPPGNGGRRLALRLHPRSPERVVCLERGACVPWAPPSSAGRLIKHAIQRGHEMYGWEVVIAYADENAGEIGGVYRGDSNWIYLGRDVGRGGAAHRVAVIPPGGTHPVQTRQHRRAGLNRAAAIAAGWRFVYEPTKHVFARAVGPRAAELRAAILGEFGVREWPTRTLLTSDGPSAASR